MKEKIDKFKTTFLRKNENKKERKKIIITKEACIIIFFIISLLIYNSALVVSKIIPYEEYNSIEFLSVVFLNPLVLIVFGFVYSFNYGFSWFLPSILSAGFLISVFYFLSLSFIFYIPIYFIFTIASELCGVSIIRVNKD